jgi:hypothetical protein
MFGRIGIMGLYGGMDPLYAQIHKSSPVHTGFGAKKGLTQVKKHAPLFNFRSSPHVNSIQRTYLFQGIKPSLKITGSPIWLWVKDPVQVPFASKPCL